MRSSSSSSSSTIKTAILLLHRGVPRTQFYAKEQLAENASLYYRVPLRLTRWLTELGWKMSMKTRSALDQYGDGEQLSEQLDVDAQRLSNALEQILPEFAPTQALPALLYGQPSIETQIENVLQSGARRLVLLPLDAHFWCFGNGTLINRAVKAIENHSRTMILDDQLTHSERVPVDDNETFRPSLHCSVIDRWSSHPLLAEFWAKQIVEHCEADSTIESLLFVAPKMIGYGAEEYWIQVGALVSVCSN